MQILQQEQEKHQKQEDRSPRRPDPPAEENEELQQKKGGTQVEGFDVYDSVSEARSKTNANTSLIFVPAAFAPDAILESVDAGIELVICITEGIPTNDMINVKKVVENELLINVVRVALILYASFVFPMMSQKQLNLSN